MCISLLVFALVAVWVLLLGAFSSCHRTESDANYWTTRTLFIAMTTSYLEESAPA